MPKGSEDSSPEANRASKGKGGNVSSEDRLGAEETHQRPGSAMDTPAPATRGNEDAEGKEQADLRNEDQLDKSADDWEEHYGEGEEEEAQEEAEEEEEEEDEEGEEEEEEEEEEADEEADEEEDEEDEEEEEDEEDDIAKRKGKGKSKGKSKSKARKGRKEAKILRRRMRSWKMKKMS